MNGPGEAEPKPLKKRLINKVGMEFLFVPGGRFVAGTDDVTPDPADLEAVRRAVERDAGEPGFSWYNYSPRHEVEVRPFYMSRTPVTQAQWTAVMGLNKATFKDGWGYPMETVNWFEAREFCRRLNEMMGTDAHRLPTEIEWEFCCRAGFDGDYGFSGPVERLEHFAWYTKNTRFRPRAVEQKKANKYGLFDMHGLVWEWTSSKAMHYPYDPADGREAPDGPDHRVVRGGSFLSDAYFCRCGFRDWHLPVHRDHDIGFRVAVS